MFPSALIKKDKKPLVGAKKVPSSPFVKSKKVPVTELVGAKAIPSEDLEGVDEVEDEKELETTKSLPPSGKLKGVKLPSKKEDMMSLELMLKGAKKKPSDDNNAVTSEGEYFKVDTDEKGMFTETGAEKEKYLRAIGKLKKKK